MTLQQLDTIQIHFIVGPGRSGTSLLINLLREHENCIVNGEIDFFLFFYKKYKDIAIANKRLLRDLKNYIKEICASKPHAFANRLNYNYLELIEVGSPITYQQITKLMYFVFNAYGKKCDAITTIVDKHPFYNYHVEKLFAVFPETNCLGLVRDYRAFAASNKHSKERYIPTLSVNYLPCHGKTTFNCL